VIALCAVLHPIERQARERRAELQQALGGVGGRIVEALVMGVVLGLVFLLGGTGGEFIYSQF
jgi:hypothetical protein